jgi:hypothetical protein
MKTSSALPPSSFQPSNSLDDSMFGLHAFVQASRKVTTGKGWWAAARRGESRCSMGYSRVLNGLARYRGPRWTSTSFAPVERRSKTAPVTSPVVSSTTSTCQSQTHPARLRRGDRLWAAQ